jgi:hypothetical protein
VENNLKNLISISCNSKIFQIEKHLKILPNKKTAHPASDSIDEADKEGYEEDAYAGPRPTISLLDQHNELKSKGLKTAETEREKREKEEQSILESVAESKALLSFKELAQGIQYENPITTSWSVPRCIVDLPQTRHDEVRDLTGITVEGDEVPPPIASFRVYFFYRNNLFRQIFFPVVYNFSNLKPQNCIHFKNQLIEFYKMM